MENPYETPTADLEINQGGGEALAKFGRFSTWYVVGLTFITLTIYLPYWMYTRTKVLNSLPSVKPIGDGFINVTLILFLGSFLMIIPELAYPDRPDIALASQVISLVANIFILVWVFKFRNRLNSFLQDNTSAPGILGPIMTFFFQVWYLSYKINENIDMADQNA